MTKCKICLKQNVKFFCKKESCKYYFCPDCYTLFLNPVPSFRKLNKYYSKDFKYQAGLDNKNRTEHRAGIVLDNLISIHPKGKTLLDVGSGLGHLLNGAQKRKLQTFGIEPSKKLQRTSLQTAANSKIYDMTLELFLKVNKQKFDFITMVHVIEHFRDPIDSIEKISSLLNDNGIFYIETPNLKSHLFITEKENYTFLTPPEHLCLFSKKSIITILKNNPSLKIIKSSTYSYSEHLMGIIKKSSKLKAQSSKLENKTYFNNKKNDSKKSWKYYLFDKILAPLFTPLLNVNGYGSILEVYIKKEF